MPVQPDIALSGKQLDFNNSVSSFLNLGRSKLELDKARATFGADVAQRQAESQASQANAQVATSTVEPQISQQKSVANSAQANAESARFHLQGEQAQRGRDIAGSLLQDPDFKNGNSEAMIQKLSDARQSMIQSGVPAPLAEANTAQLISAAVNNPQGVRQMLANIVQQGVGAQGQTAQNLVPAAAQQQVGSPDVRGNPTVINRDQFGNVQQGSMPQQLPMEQPRQPQQAAPLQFPPGENQQTYKTLSDEREAARTTISAAPVIHSLNKEILSELKIATTGQYSNIIARGQSLAGMLGLTLTGNNEQERAASAYDLIEKYTTQAATRAAQGMGNDTATALNAQLKQNASVERNPTAIKKSILFNDAVLSGAEAYQAGLEKAIQANPQMDIFTKRQFDQAWAKSFDPIIFQIYNAKKNGDTEEVRELVNSLGPRKEEVMHKAERLQLLQQGR